MTRFFTLFELAWRGLSAEERTQLRNSLLKFVVLLATAGGLGGLVMATGLANVAHVSPVPGVEVNPVNIVAREPGTGYNVKAFVDDPTTKVGQTPMTDAPNGGTRYVALRGTESVNWADSPVGQNPSATHYWTASDGTHREEAVEVTKGAADSFKRKAK